MAVVSRSLAEETTIMTESTLSMANTPATTFSSIVITTSLKDVLLPTSTSAFTSVYTQQQGQSILLTTTSSAALSSSVFKATTSRPMSPSPKETEAGIQHKAKAVKPGSYWVIVSLVLLGQFMGLLFHSKNRLMQKLFFFSLFATEKHVFKIECISVKPKFFLTLRVIN